MLRTNSKKAKENLVNYLINGARDCDYIITEGVSNENILFSIASTFNKVMLGYNIHHQSILRCYYRNNLFKAFEEWCAGLCSAIDTTYYLHSAVDTLGDILEETTEERNKFTEDQAEDMITRLLFRTLEPYILKVLNIDMMGC